MFVGLNIDPLKKYLTLPEGSGLTVSRQVIRARTTLTYLSEQKNLARGVFGNSYVWCESTPENVKHLETVADWDWDTFPSYIKVTELRDGWARQPNFLAMQLREGDDPEVYFNHFTNVCRRWLNDHPDIKREITQVVGRGK